MRKQTQLQQAQRMSVKDQMAMLFTKDAKDLGLSDVGKQIEDISTDLEEL